MTGSLPGIRIGGRGLATGVAAAVRSVSKAGRLAEPIAADLTQASRVISAHAGRPGAAVADARHAADLLANGNVMLVRAAAYRGGGSGNIDLVRLVNPLDASDVLMALRKSGGKGGIQEKLASDLANASGMGAVVPLVALESSGDTLIQLLPGSDANTLNLLNQVSLEQYIATAIRSASPAVSMEEAQRIAHLRVERMQVYDYLFANLDRAPRNVLVNPETGDMYLIDGGRIARGDFEWPGTTAIPKLDTAFVGYDSYRHVDDRVVLTRRISAETIRYFADHLDLDAIESAHASFVSRGGQAINEIRAELPNLGWVSRETATEDIAALEHAMDPSWPDGVRERWTALLNTGSFEYTPSGRW